MEALLSLVSFLKSVDYSLQDPPGVPKGGFEQLLVKGRTAKEPPEARLEETEKLTQKIA